MIARPKLTREGQSAVLKDIVSFYGEKVQEKSPEIFLSTHEIWGKLDEEVEELKEAVHIDDLDEVERELFDVIVIAIHSIGSVRMIRNHKLKLIDENENNNT